MNVGDDSTFGFVAIEEEVEEAVRRDRRAFVDGGSVAVQHVDGLEILRRTGG